MKELESKVLAGDEILRNFLLLHRSQTHISRPISKESYYCIEKQQILYHEVGWKNTTLKLIPLTWTIW
jgi:hypothetical protein